MILDFEIVHFPFLDGDVPRRPALGVYISQLIHERNLNEMSFVINLRIELWTERVLSVTYRSSLK